MSILVRADTIRSYRALSWAVGRAEVFN